MVPPMRLALACVAMLVATRAYADDPQPAGTPPAEDAPQSDTAAPEPKADPAYSEKPDSSYGHGPGDEAQCQGGPCADGGAHYFAAPAGKDITIKSYPDRSPTNIWSLSIAAGLGVVVSGVGAYYHLDSRDQSDKINAHRFTGESWTPERAAIYDEAHSSAVKAGVFYGIGGALVLGAAIAYIVTEPKMETTVIHPHVDSKPTALLAPTRGGALVGGAWSF
jgi:hypothetical protein